MKTKLSRRDLQAVRSAIWVLGLACLSLPSVYSADANADAANKPAASSEEELRNWVDFTVGGNIIRDDKAAFQQRTQQPRGAWGGVSDFHYEIDVGKKGLFE